MKNSKLFRYLDILHSSEWRGILQFFKGTIGENNDPYKLFNHIYAFRKKLSHEKLEIAYVNETMFPHLPRKSLQNIMSVLAKEIEEYWIVKDLNQDRGRKELLRLEALNKRGLYHESDKSFDKVISLTDNNKNLDLWNEYFRLKANFELYFSNNPIKSNPKKAQELIKNGMGCIKSFTSNLFLYYQSELYNRQLLNYENWETDIELIETFGLNSNLDQLSKLLLDLKVLIRGDHKNRPKSLLTLLSDKSLDMSELVKLTSFHHVRRYFIMQVRRGDKEKIEELASLIQWSIDSGMLLYNNELHIHYFIGDLNVLCALSDTDQARFYKEKNLKYLNLNDREEGELLGEMIINFVEGNYDIVLRKHSVSTFKAASRRLQATGLFLRSSYELKGKDVYYFDSYLRNTSDFLNRNTKYLSKKQVDSWKNFIKIFGGLIKQTNHQELLKKLTEAKDVIHRKWLLNKIKEGQMSAASST